ncbi:PAAR domain-containing protein [Massilia sp. TWP1-3-3]|uniref:PAAR domain-containing protein n=1 Tax=Massilia sp. TWP1-3-3 TaxID=2804573 RepID=UPI003CEB6A7A
MSIIGFIVVGDRTSHGGTVVSGDSTYTIDDHPIARVGDKVFCPRCKMSTVIVTSRFPSASAFGQALAYDQDSTSCGALLYSRHNGHAGWSVEGDDPAPKSTPVEAGEAPASKALRFQEHFILHDGAGTLMSNVPYVVTTGEGKTFEGDTDAEGRTAVVWTDSPDALDVQVGDKPPNSDDPYHYDEPTNEGL